MSCRRNYTSFQCLVVGITPLFFPLQCLVVGITSLLSPPMSCKNYSSFVLPPMPYRRNYTSFLSPPMSCRSILVQVPEQFPQIWYNRRAPLFLTIAPRVKHSSHTFGSCRLLVLQNAFENFRLLLNVRKHEG
uniref:Uncharacterized protein n=1 Tax=Cacopsylla melanoneura TaxID=428564 RepID=A0A8D8RT65_9HEMI